MSIVPSPPANATTTARGLMSAADKAKLDGLSASPVSAVTQANGLTLTTGTLAMGAAGVAAPGAVTTGAQEFAGAKTLTGAILNGVTTIAEAVTSLVRAAAASLVLRSSLGAGASDVAVKVGTSETDAGTATSAKPFSVRTGLGGTEVEKFFVSKTGPCSPSGFYFGSIDNSSAYNLVIGTTAQLLANTVGIILSAPAGELRLRGNGITTMIAYSTGAIGYRGTDSSASPGAATIDKATGKSAIANGASSVVITNSLCAAASRVMVTFHADPGSRYWVVPGAGFFTVNLSSAAGANLAFSWEVSNII